MKHPLKIFVLNCRIPVTLLVLATACCLVNAPRDGWASPAPQTTMRTVREVEVKTSDAAVRARPGFLFRIVETLPLGTRIRVDQKQGDWVRLPGRGWMFLGDLTLPGGQLPEGDTGPPKKTAELPPPKATSTPPVTETGAVSSEKPPARVVTRPVVPPRIVPVVPVVPVDPDHFVVNVSAANVRSGPSLDFPVMRKIPRNESVRRIDEHNGWYALKNGGWLFHEIVQPYTPPSVAAVDTTEPEPDTPPVVAKAKPEPMPVTPAATPKAKPEKTPVTATTTPRAKPETTPVTATAAPKAKPETTPVTATATPVATPESTPEETPVTPAVGTQEKPETKPAPATADAGPGTTAGRSAFPEGSQFRKTVPPETWEWPTLKIEGGIADGGTASRSAFPPTKATVPPQPSSRTPLMPGQERGKTETGQPDPIGRWEAGTPRAAIVAVQPLGTAGGTDLRNADARRIELETPPKEWSLLFLTGAFVKVEEVFPADPMGNKLTKLLNEATNEDFEYRFLRLYIEVPPASNFEFLFAGEENRVVITLDDGQTFGNFIQKEGALDALAPTLQKLFRPFLVQPGQGAENVLVFRGGVDLDAVAKIEFYLNGRANALIPAP